MFQQSDRVIVVGSAPSLLEVDPSDITDSGATVIAINGAIKWLKKADYWFTLDPARSMLAIMQNQVAGCHYVACGGVGFKAPQGVTQLVRNEGTNFGWCRAVKGLSEDSGSINTGNSGYGGLGLAYHLKPKKILLLGIDASNAQQVDGEYPGKDKLSHLPELFATAVEQLDAAGIEVVAGSLNSNVICFPRMSVKEGLAWLQK